MSTLKWPLRNHHRLRQAQGKVSFSLTGDGQSRCFPIAQWGLLLLVVSDVFKWVFRLDNTGHTHQLFTLGDPNQGHALSVAAQ